MSKNITLFQMARLFVLILAPERKFLWIALVYGIGISLLSLATPISVQLLINTVANTALTTPLLVLSGTLFGLLMFAVLLNGLRTHLMEIFTRRFYARMVSEIAIRLVYAQNPHFGDERRTALFNRYFDILSVQKTIPVLFIGGFTIILQAGVGFTVVAFYHPLFLAFVLVIIGLIWLIWFIWGASGVRTSIELSHRKHETAAWLEGLGASNGFFKSQKRIDYALAQTDAKMNAYIQQHKKHFRRHFSQTLAFLILYAVASGVLLGLGGWLVIQNELTIGQLVAAELILSAAFFGVSQLGVYLNYFYDLCAGVEELSLFYDVPQEEPPVASGVFNPDHTLAFIDVKGRTRAEDVTFNMTLPMRQSIMVSASEHGILRLFTDFVKRYVIPDSGFITMGGIDLSYIEASALRQEIFVLNRPNFIENTIRGYLELSRQGNDPTEIMKVLDCVGLTHVLSQFELGLDTPIAETGWPLSMSETIQLKLASAMLARPNIIILSQMYDLVDRDDLARALEWIWAQGQTTIIYFSNREDPMGFEHFMYMQANVQTHYDDFETYRHAAKTAENKLRLARSNPETFTLPTPAR